MGMHIVVVGNPIDGVKVYGPFKTAAHADDWATCHVDVGTLADWWIAPLHSPEVD